MIINIDKAGTVEGFKRILDEAAKNDSVKGLLVLSCDANGFTPDTVDEILKGVSVPLFGGIFPAIIHGNERLEKGTIVAGMSIKPDVRIIPGLSDMTVEYDDLIDSIIPDSGGTKTMFVFVDGFSKRISSFIESLFVLFGLEFNYILILKIES